MPSLKGELAGIGEGEEEIMKNAAYLVILEILMLSPCRAQTNKADVGAPPKLEKMPEALEIRFASSAAPPPVRDNATIYVLDPAKGYRIANQGTNGVSCIVIRTDWQWPSPPFRDDIYWPVCYDSEGSRTLLQDYFYAAELRARGMDSKQVHEAVTKRFGTPESPNPSRTGVAYMIAPIMRGYTSAPGPVTMNMPHYMFYAPGVKDADIGGHGFSKQYPFILDMSAGRDDYFTLVVGETEKTRILDESKDLLNDLCSYRDYLCTTSETRARTPIDKAP
jgi:hypothetical protein